MSAANVLAPLERCQQAAASIGVGARAYQAWRMARELGTETAQQMFSRTSWFRYRRIWRAAGLDLPDGHAEPGPGCVDSPGWGQVALMALPRRRFTVADTWDPTFWPVGTEGAVVCVLLHDLAWWVEFVPASDETAPERLRLAEFLRRTEPNDA